MACCVPKIGADARVDDGDVEEKSLILESGVVVEECPCVRVCVSVCVFIKLHITTQSGPVILVIICHSH